ncbi:MAG: T9SS type A sorting domain-containing protein [Crocinitomicaceae bacterium]
MKKLFLLFVLPMSLGINAQVLFSEDFDGIPGATAGGAGTYAFPSGWFLRNVDNATPSASVSYINEAWERREDFANNVADSCAMSTSWYTAAGTSNDWMWTPLIGVLPANCILNWNALAYDPLYPDSYEVRVMTSTVGPPTGGAGAIGNQITGSTVLFSIVGENSTWTNRTASLSAYAGQSIYIGFRNTANDKFILVIDDVVVSALPGVDAAVSQTTTQEYTITPVTHMAAIGTEGTIANIGAGALTNVVLNVDILDAGMNSVYAASSAAMASLAAGASSNFTVPGFVPTTAGTYTVNLTASFTQVDSNPVNDLATYQVVVSDTVYARDDATVTGSLGIGAGNGGQLGQTFELLQADELTSLSIYIANTQGNLTGQPLSGSIYATDVTGTPTTLIANTATITLDATTDTFWTLPMVSGALTLAAGTYVCVVNEADSTMSIGTSTGNFQAGKGWINWPTSPFSGWANPEAFGSQFAVTFLLRANFGTCAPTNVSLTETTCDASYLSPSGNYIWSATGIYNDTVFGANTCDTIYTIDLTIDAVDLTVSDAGNVITSAQVGGTYQWIDCATGDPIAGANQQSFTPTVNGNYAVVVGLNNCFDTSNCTAITTIGLTENELNNRLAVFPNPSNGTFQVTVNAANATDLKVELTDATGKVVNTSYHKANGTQTTLDINATRLETGMYLLKVTADDQQWTERVIISRK